MCPSRGTPEMTRRKTFMTKRKKKKCYFVWRPFYRETSHCIWRHSYVYIYIILLSWRCPWRVWPQSRYLLYDIIPFIVRECECKKQNDTKSRRCDGDKQEPYYKSIVFVFPYCMGLIRFTCELDLPYYTRVRLIL